MFLPCFSSSPYFLNFNHAVWYNQLVIFILQTTELFRHERSILALDIIDVEWPIRIKYANRAGQQSVIILQSNVLRKKILIANKNFHYK